MKQGYVPMGKQVRAVEIALYLVIVVDLVSIESTMSEMALLGRIAARGAFSVEEIQSNDSRQGAIAALGLIATFVLGVLFIQWTRQGYRNADIVAPGVRRFGHGWAIGAWFTPFLAAWRPKQIVNDIYAAGHDRKSGSKDQLLTWWWATLLISGTITYTVARSRPDTLTGLRTADRWLTFANVLEIVAAVLAVLVVRKVSAALDAAGRRGLSPAMEPPATASVPPPGWAQSG
jgi:hypothetical protein